jgi:hypothetical protein
VSTLTRSIGQKVLENRRPPLWDANLTMRDPEGIKEVRRQRMRDTEHDHGMRRKAERNAVTTNRRNSRWLQARRLVLPGDSHATPAGSGCTPRARFG